MKSLLIFTIALTFAFITLDINSQPFTAISTPLENVEESSVSFGDFDNDGDLDIILTGLDAQGSVISMFYINDEGNYSPLAFGIPPVYKGTAAWGDYDADNDLDLLLTGNGSSGYSSRIYQNQEGMFVDIQAGLVGVENGVSAWGDYDNDGDLDLVLSGNWIAKVYRNDEGTFVDIGMDFGYYNSSSAAWGDYDNDGDLDLLLTGDSGAGAVTKIYKNENGQFTDIEAGLPGTMAGQCGWVDFDNDSDTDLYLTGFDDALEPMFRLFKNDGDGVFTEMVTWISGVALSSVAWGDYDNDGDQDVAYAGKGAGCGLYVAEIFRNDGDYFTDINASLLDLTRGSMEWADFDNDGDLDLLSSGAQSDNLARTRLYRNDAGSNQFSPNTPPEVPSGLETTIVDGMIELSWNAASDQQTPVDGLSYNIRISTEENGCNVLSPMADEVMGYRRIVANGNSFQNLSWSFAGLPPGDYYWSVQAIDQGYMGSEFAGDESFTVTATSIHDLQSNNLNIDYNPGLKMISVSGNSKEDFQLFVFDTNGRLVIYRTNENQIDLGALNSGLHLIRLVCSDQDISKKIFVN